MSKEHQLLKIETFIKEGQRRYAFKRFDSSFFDELLELVKAAQVSTRLTGYRLLDTKTELYAMKGLERWSTTGKVWSTEAHLKSALTNRFGSANDTSKSSFRKRQQLMHLEVINVGTGERSSAYELWLRPKKR